MIETVLLTINIIVLVFLVFSIEFPKNASIIFKYIPLLIAILGMTWLMTDIKGLFWTVLIIGVLNILSTVATENEMPPWGVLFIKVVPFSIGAYSIIYYFTAQMKGEIEMNFNPENITNPKSAEFKLLKAREDKIMQLNKILEDMENERNLLYSDIKRGAEPN